MSIDRRALRATLTVSMGIKNNSDVFESSGNSWHSTPAEERREAVAKQLLKETLRTIHSHVPKQKPRKIRDSEQPHWTTVTPISDRKLTTKERLQAIDSIKKQIADPGVLLPVIVDKQQLAKEERSVKPVHSCRNPRRGNVCAAVSKALRMAQLDKELKSNELTAQKYSGKFKVLPHFTEVIEKLDPREANTIIEAGRLYQAKIEARTFSLLTYVFSFRSVLSPVGQNPATSVV